MKKVKGWTRVGIVLSVAWLVLTSFAYFNELINHPSHFTSDLPHSSFEWIKDIEGTEKAHTEAKAKGEDFSYNFVFMKPTFNLKGYFMLAILPLLVWWLVSLLIIWVVRWVREGFRT